MRLPSSCGVSVFVVTDARGVRRLGSGGVRCDVVGQASVVGHWRWRFVYMYSLSEWCIAVDVWFVDCGLRFDNKLSGSSEFLH